MGLHSKSIRLGLFIIWPLASNAIAWRTCGGTLRDRPVAARRCMRSFFSFRQVGADLTMRHTSPFRLPSYGFTARHRLEIRSLRGWHALQALIMNLSFPSRVLAWMAPMSFGLTTVACIAILEV